MTEPDPNLPLESRLCLSCGLCCDGTVYGFALIREDEIEDTARIGLKTKRTDNGTPAFNLGCHYLDGATCTRYKDWRPSPCSEYFCHVQTRTRKEQLTEERAFEKIARARRMADEVKAVLPPGMPISQARHHFKELAAKQPDITPTEASFIVKMFVLERFLDAEFRGPKRNHLPDGAAASVTACTS